MSAPWRRCCSLTTTATTCLAFRPSCRAATSSRRAAGAFHAWMHACQAFMLQCRHERPQSRIRARMPYACACHACVQAVYAAENLWSPGHNRLLPREPARGLRPVRAGRRRIAAGGACYRVDGGSRRRGVLASAHRARARRELHAAAPRAGPGSRRTSRRSPRGVGSSLPCLLCRVVSHLPVSGPLEQATCAVDLARTPILRCCLMRLCMHVLSGCARGRNSHSICAHARMPRTHTASARMQTAGLHCTHRGGSGAQALRCGAGAQVRQFAYCQTPGGRGGRVGSEGGGRGDPFPLYMGLSWTVEIVRGWRVAAAQLRHRVPCWGYVFQVCRLGPAAEAEALPGAARLQRSCGCAMPCRADAPVMHACMRARAALLLMPHAAPMPLSCACMRLAASHAVRS
jgi:hypothetical protein